MKTVHKIVTTLFLSGIFFISNAADVEWVEVFREDFGGNDVTDPSNPPVGTADPFTTEQVPNLVFTGSTVGNGTYFVTKQSEANGGLWHTGSDHTYIGDVTRGYYMRINPKAAPEGVVYDIMYRQKLEGICRGVTFRFSVFLANIVTDPSQFPPRLAVGIYSDPDGKNLLSPLALNDLTLSEAAKTSEINLNWKELSLDFTMDNNSDEAYFIVSTVDAESNGFDFGMDDISISVQHPVVTVSNLQEYEYQAPVKLGASFENNGYFSNMNSVVCKWYYSPDGVNYQEIYNESYANDHDLGYTIPSFDKDLNNGYYRVRIGETGSLDSKICYIEGDFRINETTNKKHIYICEGGSIDLGNGIVLNADDVTDGQTFSAPGGFSYVVHLLKPKIEIVGSATVCKGTEFEYKGETKTYMDKGLYLLDDTIRYVASECDSLISRFELNVTKDDVHFAQDTSICQGETYKGKTFTDVGTEAFVSTDNCVELHQNVHVFPAYPSIDKTLYGCAGSKFEGLEETFDYGGEYHRTLRYKTKAKQCDSIVNATIIISDKIIAELPDTSICEGKTFIFDGKTYSAPGVYDLMSKDVSKVSGCDSFTTRKLYINARYSNENNPIDTVICYGSHLFGTYYEEPTTTPLLVRDPYTYQSVAGCDSIVWFSLTVLKIELRLKVKSNRDVVCVGEQVEIDVANLKPADALLEWNHVYSGTKMKAIFTPKEDMTYVVLARNQAAGCESTDTVRIGVRDSPELTIDEVDQKENKVTYHVDGGTLPYSIILDKKEIGEDGSGEILNSFIGAHKLSVKDSTGCVSTQGYEIVPIPVTPTEFFTPDGDGVNDLWTIENIDVYAKARVRIFSRDGRLLKEYNGYDNSEGWDGRYQGHMMPPTDYWYEINLPEIDRQILGHFTLIYNQHE